MGLNSAQIKISVGSRSSSPHFDLHINHYRYHFWGHVRFYRIRFR